MDGALFTSLTFLTHSSRILDARDGSRKWVGVRGSGRLACTSVTRWRESRAILHGWWNVLRKGGNVDVVRGRPMSWPRSLTADVECSLEEILFSRDPREKAREREREKNWNDGERFHPFPGLSFYFYRSREGKRESILFGKIREGKDCSEKERKKNESQRNLTFGWWNNKWKLKEAATAWKVSVTKTRPIRKSIFASNRKPVRNVAAFKQI